MEDDGNSMLRRALHASTLEWIGLIVTIAVLIWLIARIRTWFLEDDDLTAQDHEMLLQFRDLHRQGDLTEGEFRSIKGRLTLRDNDSPSETVQ